MENEYIQNHYLVFEKKLIDRYGKQKRHKLLSNYVKDFSEQKKYPLFFKSFQVDTTSSEFHRMFIKNSQLPQEEDILGSDIYEIVVISTDDKKKVSEPERDYYILNPNSIYMSCIMQQKSKNDKVNNLFQYITIDVSPMIVASAIDLSFKKNEYNDQLLQMYIMFHLFLLPNLHLQNM